MRKELVIPWQFKGQQGYNVLMCRKWKHSFLESSCIPKLLVVLCFLWKWYDQCICCHKSWTSSFALFYLLGVGVYVLCKVGLCTQLALDDIEGHWSKFIYICKFFVIHENHKWKRQHWLSSNKNVLALFTVVMIGVSVLLKVSSFSVLWCSSSTSFYLFHFC